MRQIAKVRVSSLGVVGVIAAVLSWGAFAWQGEQAGAAHLLSGYPSPQDENVYNSDEAFDKLYEPAMTAKNRGDAAAALELIDELVKQLSEVRPSAPRTEDGEDRWLVARTERVDLLRDLNRNDEALQAYKTLIDETKDIQHLAGVLLHLQIRINYANNLFRAGQAQSSLEELRDTIASYEALAEKHPGDERIDLQRIVGINNLATTLFRVGKHPEALQYFEGAISELHDMEIDGESRDRKLISPLLNAGVVSAMIGDPVRARKYLEQSIEVAERVGEDAAQDMIRARLTLGAILGRLGQYREASETYQAVVTELRTIYPKERYPDGSVDLAIALDNLAISHVRLEQYEEALPLAQEANAMFEALAAKSPGLRINYARSSANMALLHARLDQRRPALTQLDAAITAYEGLFPNGHVEMPGLYRSRAIVLGELRESAESIESGTQALDAARKLFPVELYSDGHSVLVQTLDVLGMLHFAAGELREAESYFQEALQMQAKLAKQVIRYSSEAEALQFLATSSQMADHLLTVDSDPETTYSIVSRNKARLLEQQKSRHRALIETDDPELQDLFSSYQAVRAAIAKIATAPNASPAMATQLQQLQSRREELERDIAEMVEASVGDKGDPTLREGIVKQIDAVVASSEDAPSSQAELESKLAALEPEAVVIELFTYEHYSVEDSGEARKSAGESRIAAFVLDGRAKSVRRVDLGPAQSIRDQVRRLVYAFPFGAEQQLLQKFSNEICPPLQSEIPEGTERLYIIPDGIMSNVPFASLLDPNTSKTWLETYEILICSSLDSVFLPQHSMNPAGAVVAIGDVDYGDIDQESEVDFKPLPGTIEELRNLKKRFGDADVEALTGSSATMEQLSSLLPEAEVLHIATHAYVTPFARSAVTDGGLRTGAVRVSADQRSPLLATRVAMSGANQNRTEPNSILSGEAFAQLDLRDTVLVVLSACESGIGERITGEGVYALPRAFHIAGAETVVATLWPVSDEDAAKMMDEFYRQLLENDLPPAAALRAAQLVLSRQSSEDQETSETPLLRGVTFKKPGTASNSTGRDVGSELPEDVDPRGRSTWAAFFVSRG